MCTQHFSIHSVREWETSEDQVKPGWQAGQLLTSSSVTLTGCGAISTTAKKSSSCWSRSARPGASSSLDQHWTNTRTPLFLHTAPRHTRTPSNILHGLNHRSWRSRQGGAVPDQEEKASHQKLTKEEKGRQARTRSRRRRAGNQSSHHCIKNQQQ
jgi:hypothetical protein